MNKEFICTCKDCEYTWDASETEHFNFSCCEQCFLTSIKGYGN